MDDNEVKVTVAIPRIRGVIGVIEDKRTFRSHMLQFLESFNSQRLRLLYAIEKLSGKLGQGLLAARRAVNIQSIQETLEV